MVTQILARIRHNRVKSLASTVALIFYAYHSSNELIATGQYLDAGFTLIAAFIAFGVAFYFLKVPQPTIAKTLHFKAFSTDDIWNRTALRTRIVQQIRGAEKVATVISGPSGSGKSILLRTMIPDELMDEYAPIHIDTYHDFRSKLVDELAKHCKCDPDLIRNLQFDPVELVANSSLPILLTLDQVEQITGSPIKDMNWLRMFLERILESPRIRCTLIVRRDFYYRLRFLGKLLPSPETAIEVLGIRLDKEDIRTESGEISEFVRRLEHVVTSDLKPVLLQELSTDSVEEVEKNVKGELPLEEVSRILPLEAQIVGQVLEWHSSRSQCVSLQQYKDVLQGKQGLLREYLEVMTSAASTNRDLTFVVLYALSTDRVLRKSVSIKTLEAISYTSAEEIKLILTFMFEQQLIIKTAEDRYEWSHDFLAQAFREYSAPMMEPALRDHVLSKVDQVQLDRADDSHVFQEMLCRRKIIKVNCAMVVATFAIFLGVVYHRYCSGVFEALSSMDSTKEPAYALVAVAHWIWAVFVWRLTRHYFIRVKPRLRCGPWWFPIFVGFCTLVTTIFLPRFWIIAMGCVSLAVAVCFIRGLPETSRWRHPVGNVLRTAAIFLFAAGAMLGVGVWYWIEVNLVQSGRQDKDVMDILTSALVIGFIILGCISIFRYTMPQKYWVMLATLDRSRTPIKADSH